MLTIKLRRPPDTAPPRRRARPGQTLVEFALTLPILLLLIFGIIEFGRIFQAWVTIQNAARTAARYGVTGQYNQTVFQDLNNPWTPDTVGDVRDGMAPSWPVNYGVAYPDGQKPGDGVPCTLNDTRGAFNSVGVNVGGDIWHYPGDAPADPTDAYFFASHWNGKRCDPALDEDRWLRQDVLRLYSMTEAARVGAAGLGVAPWVRIPGTGINSEPGGDASLMPGWFHVFVCSSRASMTDEYRIENDLSRYRYDLAHRTDGTNYGFAASGIRLCTVEEVVKPDGATDMNAVAPYTNPADRQGINQYDPGGPGDFVEVVVYFNHPLITPLGLGRNDGSGPYVLLQARRTMINESFRTARVLELPNQGLGRTPGAPSSPTPTHTPSQTPTRTPSLSPTPSLTPSGTASPTPAPSCSDVRLVAQPPSGGAAQPFMFGQNLQMFIQNDNFGPVYISMVHLQWVRNASYPDLYPLNFKLFNPDNGLPLPNHWAYNGAPNPSIPNPPRSDTFVNASYPGWRPAEAGRIIPGGGKVTTWQATFVNGPANLTDIYNVRDWPLIQLEVTWPGNGTPCLLEYTATPDTTPEPPAQTCVDPNLYSLSFVTFQQYGVVRFDLDNRDTRPVSIVEISFNWQSYFSGMNLGRVAAKGVTAFSPDTVVMWQSPPGVIPPDVDEYGTTFSNAADPNWRQAPVFPAGSSGPIWLDFDGTNGNLQAENPGRAHVSDFNGSFVRLSNGCVVAMANAATPQPTATYTNTPTPTFTPTPTDTVTPSPTITPSNTLTPTLPPGFVGTGDCAVNPTTGRLTANITVTNNGGTNSTAIRIRVIDSTGAVVMPTATSVPTGSNYIQYAAPQNNGWTRSYTVYDEPGVLSIQIRIAPSGTNFTGSSFVTIGTVTCGAGTNTPTNTATFTFTPTFTPSRTFTPSQTYTPSRTFTPSQTFTRTFTFTPSRTFTPSNTPSRTLTPSNTPTFTPSNTRTFTYTPSRTFTPSNTPTRTPTFTPSNTPTRTLTFTPSNTPTNTATRTPTYTWTFTYTPSRTLTPSNTPTRTPSFTSTFTPTASQTFTRTWTPSPTYTSTQTTVDLAATKTANRTGVPYPVYGPSQVVVYTITVTNSGPSAANGARIYDAVSNLLSNITWSCSAAGGATCGTVPGSGATLLDTTVNIPVGGSVTYTVTAYTPSVAQLGGITRDLPNTVTVTAPSGAAETNTANNSASRTIRVSPSCTGSEC